MKRTIVLNVEYVDARKLNKAQELEKREEVFEASLEKFKQQLAEDKKSFKILRTNYLENELVIDFSEAVWDKLYDALRTADAVSLIDAMVYEEDK